MLATAALPFVLLLLRGRSRLHWKEYLLPRKLRCMTPKQPLGILLGVATLSFSCASGSPCSCPRAGVSFLPLLPPPKKEKEDAGEVGELGLRSGERVGVEAAALARHWRILHARTGSGSPGVATRNS